MYLKSIEVNGFKSFANKIIFDFHDGITGIVGPNGSGKSNVADAVRWVLGEQSAKQLRGSRMEDVIFSGTEIRKAQSSAYVAITLDNSDHKLPIEYEEVKVARRVFRSGESEYLINGTACRLRDIQELFLDTGIGKEGYSIIGQGQIEKILSGKPEDRRELFDEAAGIVKFKKRKYTAEKNLAEEINNLSRIKDILHEIEIQVEPLRKQSEKAKEYLLLRDELRNYDINLFLAEYERINDDDITTNKNIDITKAQLESSNAEYDNTKEEYERIEAELEVLNGQIDSIKNTLSDDRIKNEKLEGDINVLVEQIAAFNVSLSHYQDRINQIKEQINAKEENLKETTASLEENDVKFNALNDLKVQYDEKYINAVNNINSYTKEIEKRKKTIISMMNSESVIKSKLERNATLLEQNKIKKTELNQKLFKQKVVEEEINNQITEYETELGKIDETIEKLTTKNEELEERIAQIQKQINSYKSSYEQKQQESLKEKSRLESLKNLTERYEGYGNSIKKVMERKVKDKGIVGVVADVIKVESKYETAIEIALGGAIQNIITEDENVAKNLIKYLKDNKFGRATFLPLTTVKSKGDFPNAGALKEKGAIGPANELITTDNKFNELLKNLVGKVLVVDNIDNALVIARKYNNSLRIVTLEGELLSPGGSMSGGAYKNTSNLLSRRREIKDIEDKIAKIDEEIKDIFAKANDLRGERTDLNMDVEDNKDELSDLNLKKNTVTINLKAAMERLDEAKGFYNDISQETKAVIDSENQINTLLNDLNGQLANNNQTSSENEALIKELEQKLENAKNSEKEANEKLMSISKDYSALEQGHNFISENKQRIEDEIKVLQSEVDELSQKLGQSDSQANEKNEEIENKRKEIEDNKKDIESLVVALEEANKVKEEKNSSHKSFFAKREELSDSISRLDKELFRLNAHKEKITEQLESFVNYMWEEYELTYGTALKYKNEETAKDGSLKKKISELKTKIKALGDVNVNAVEDYKNLVERYELLKTQHDDLVESEQALRKIIEQLDDEMRKQFNEKFEQIKEQFDIVFRQLFGGGKANLELTVDEDILEAGIRINAQPPGKKLQNMMQLSGGEKALTAISLLFAIQNLKPSPFCLLDEIEAALDDSNVKRFAQYLHKLTKNTQFIVITHRRGTMSAADILYGITMQEKGVSTLVSVNLIEEQLDK